MSPQRGIFSAYDKASFLTPVRNPTSLMTPTHDFYISGPMAGYEEYNFPSFALAAEKLREHGFLVLSPNEFELEPGDEYDLSSHELRASYLRMDFTAIAACKNILMLPDWEESTGACIELLVALFLGLGIYEINPKMVIRYMPGTRRLIDAANTRAFRHIIQLFMSGYGAEQMANRHYKMLNY